MKKAVMVPIEHDEDGLPTTKENEYGPFNRGVLQFDDYNYTVINPYILLTGNENKDPKEKKKKSKSGKS